ncbi:hypothetical protein [Vagococcus fluvialis]|nr:hypothetical protein [Vagococcus fluvialis]UDM84047.1 hypothetical protein K5K96_14580 [Vagococcus fluvialis]
MSEAGTREDIEKLKDNSNVYGYVIGHWTTDEEDEEYGCPIVFRRIVERKDVTDEWLKDIDEETEFIGLLYSDNDNCDLKGLKEPEYTMFLDERTNEFGHWHIGVRTGEIKYP